MLVRAARQSPRPLWVFACSAVIPIGPEVLSSLTQWMRVVLACFGIGLGLLVCCLGVRVIKICAFLLGFGVGAVTGGVIAWRVSYNDKTTLIAAASVGAVLGLLSLCIVKFGRYIAGAVICFLPVFLFIQMGGPRVRICAWIAAAGSVAPPRCGRLLRDFL